MNPMDPATAAALRELSLKYPNIEEIQKQYGGNLVNTPAGQRGDFFSLDPGGALGVRQDKIEQLSEKYKPGQGFTDGFGRELFGITDQDLANYRMTQYNQERAAIDPRYQYGKENFPEGQEPNAATTTTNLSKSTKRVATSKQLVSEINKIQNGAALLAQATAKYGRFPNNNELQIIKTEALASTPQAKQKLDLGKAQIDAVRQDIDASKATVKIGKRKAAVAEGNLAINQVQAENQRSQQEWQNKDTVAGRQWEADQASRKEAFLADQNNATRQLQFEISERDRAERREERDSRERRDDRDRRQLMLLQLLKGLREMGQSFSF